MAPFLYSSQRLAPSGWIPYSHWVMWIRVTTPVKEKFLWRALSIDRKPASESLQYYSAMP